MINSLSPSSFAGKEGKGDKKRVISDLRTPGAGLGKFIWWVGTETDKISAAIMT